MEDGTDFISEVREKLKRANEEAETIRQEVASASLQRNLEFFAKHSDKYAHLFRLVHDAMLERFRSDLADKLTMELVKSFLAR